MVKNKDLENLEQDLVSQQEAAKQKMEMVKTLLNVERQRLIALKLHLDMEKMRYFELLDSLKKRRHC